MVRPAWLFRAGQYADKGVPNADRAFLEDYARRSNQLPDIPMDLEHGPTESVLELGRAVPGTFRVVTGRPPGTDQSYQGDWIVADLDVDPYIDRKLKQRGVSVLLNLTRRTIDKVAVTASPRVTGAQFAAFNSAAGPMVLAYTEGRYQPMFTMQPGGAVPPNLTDADLTRLADLLATRLTGGSNGDGTPAAQPNGAPADPALSNLPVYPGYLTPGLFGQPQVQPQPQPQQGNPLAALAGALAAVQPPAQVQPGQPFNLATGVPQPQPIGQPASQPQPQVQPQPQAFGGELAEHPLVKALEARFAAQLQAVQTQAQAANLRADSLDQQARADRLARYATELKADGVPPYIVEALAPFAAGMNAATVAFADQEGKPQPATLNFQQAAVHVLEQFRAKPGVPFDLRVGVNTEARPTLTATFNDAVAAEKAKIDSEPAFADKDGRTRLAEAVRRVRERGIRED